ncbi:DUF4870 domain-containing protein [Robiginitalea sp. M366]|uniref:DUF4870 domain-containing protein n=1 Tax=Robiginitalea aestuariiviva TaxID=3036903 RepID=UPI00240DA563|nr:DUF4870 domain-containing protein [Robiginitalea aestuariiviva]MDG1573395.1 DUF4870 domain-containing protein [Robiginitalea aestuariiviva]
MTESVTKHERNLSAVIHGSTLCRFFIPLGHFLLPLVLWLSNKNQSAFVDYHGKQALNFQISMTLYNFMLGLLSVPFLLGSLPAFFRNGGFHWNEWEHMDDFHLNLGDGLFDLPFFWWPVGVAGLLGFGLFIVNVVYTILATLRTNEGDYFKYPLTIKFIR